MVQRAASGRRLHTDRVGADDRTTRQASQPLTLIEHWDGSTWAKQAPASSPPARADAAMAYDAATGNVVLFGGVGLAGDSVPFGDTWTWG